MSRLRAQPPDRGTPGPPEPESSPQTAQPLWHERLSATLDLVLSALAIVMLVLLVIELGDLASDEWRPRVIQANTAIWVVFVVAFFFELAVAPSKSAYLRGHWLSALSLAIPFLRVFRIARAVRVLRAGRVLRGLTLGRTFGAINRARKVLVSFAAVSQFAYVTALAVAITSASAALVFALERGAPDSQINSFPDALWWGVTVVTAGGGTVETTTLEARLVSVLLRIFGVGVVGYLTARIAVFFLGNSDRTDAERAQATDLTARHLREEREELRALRDEIRALRSELRDGAPRESERAGRGGRSGRSAG
jgi:voltage-gated potassium channel